MIVIFWLARLTTLVCVFILLWMLIFFWSLESWVMIMIQFILLIIHGTYAYILWSSEP